MLVIIIIIIITTTTSDKEVMFLVVYSCLFVCLSVSNITQKLLNGFR